MKQAPINKLPMVILAVSLLLVLTLSFPEMSKSQSVAVKANAGTLGAGGEITVGIIEPLNARIGANLLNVGYFYETDPGEEFDVEIELGLQNGLVMIDWHPFRRHFRLSAGMIYNANRITTELIPKQTYEVGGDVITPDDLGNLHVDMTFSPWVPMVSAGFGNAFRGSRFGGHIELGTVFQGSPGVSMKADGLLAPSAEQAPTLEQNLSWFTAYPVITFSLSYRIYTFGTH